MKRQWRRWTAQELDLFERTLAARPTITDAELAAILDRPRSSVSNLRAGRHGGRSPKRYYRRLGEPSGSKERLRALLAERDARLSRALTPDMIVLGDPPPGRSALDRQGAAIGGHR